MAKKNRRSIWQAILRFFGLLAEEANDRMDNAVDIETQLERKIKSLKERREEILNNPTLSKAIGLPEQLDAELIRENKKYADKNYDKTIAQLMKGDKREQARNVLSEKKNHENNITFVKERLKTATAAKTRIQNDLDILAANIAKATNELNELKQRNRFAQQSNEIYGLMGQIEDISVGMDVEGISDAVNEREQEAFGRRSEYERRTATQTANREAQNADLDAELDGYLNK